LLGLTFHPGYDNSGSVGYRKFYVYYSAPPSTPTNNPTTPQDHVSVLAEYQFPQQTPTLPIPMANASFSLKASRRRTTMEDSWSLVLTDSST